MYFEFDGHRLVYDEYGGGERVVVLLPGLLFSRKMHRPLAEALAEHGYRVLCLDLLGHGDSDRPEEMWNYSMTIFGRQAIALLDHVGVKRAVIGGTSLGANASLEAAAAAPRLLQASSILELRLTPERLTNEIVLFMADCFRPQRSGEPGRRPAPARGRRTASERRPS
jgi:pimeloyl-ACP methyl ester carboxylesterase